MAKRLSRCGECDLEATSRFLETEHYPCEQRDARIREERARAGEEYRATVRQRFADQLRQRFTVRMVAR